MNGTIITLSVIAILLAFLAGVVFMRNRAARDIRQVAQFAADEQERTSHNFYWALQVINGVAYDEHNRLKPHKYPAHKVKEAKEILKSMGVEE